MREDKNTSRKTTIKKITGTGSSNFVSRTAQKNVQKLQERKDRRMRISSKTDQDRIDELVSKKNTGSKKGQIQQEKKSNKNRGKKRTSGRRPNLQTNAERIVKATKSDGDQRDFFVPKIAKDTLRIIPLGGQEEVGRNMVVFEYENDIVIVDIGMQFPEEDMPGIDYIVPNVNYLKGKEKNIRGVIFTHGHLDHIGAAPIILKQLGYPPVIARDLTLALVKKRLEDGDPGASNRIKTISIKDVHKKVRLGSSFRAHFFEVDHSIMDSMGVALETPVGTPIHFGDWMISHDPVSGNKISYEHLAKLPEPRILMLESLAVSYSKKDPVGEKEIQKNLESLVSDAPGRIIIGTFASQVQRIKLLLQYAQKIGKKVVLDGYSMKTNVEVARELGYFKISSDLIIPMNDIAKYPENKILVLCTGAQGEYNAVLNRIVTDNHRFIKLQKNDTVVFSSSVIPGNERTIQRLKDNMYRKCDNVVHSDIMNTHIGGHATLEDMHTVMSQVKPQYFLPVYANYYMLKEAGKQIVSKGFSKDKVIILDNGSVVEFNKKGSSVRREKADTSYVFIDGLGIGDIGHVVLRDRQMLSQDGMYVITVLVDSKTKEVVGNMQITSRGFIFVKDNFDLINETKRKVQKIIKETTSKDTKMDWKQVENNIRDRVGEYLFQKTQRRPMVLPVVIEV